MTLIKASTSPDVSLTILMKDNGKPILEMIWNRNYQSTLSKALEKSSLRKIESCLDFLAHDRVSWVNRMLSKMNMFFKYTH